MTSFDFLTKDKHLQPLRRCSNGGKISHIDATTSDFSASGL